VYYNTIRNYGREEADMHKGNMSKEDMTIYPGSVHSRGDSDYCIVAADARDMLYVSGQDMALFDDETISHDGEIISRDGGTISNAGEIISRDGEVYKLCSLTNKNAEIIRELFEFARPRSHKGHDVTIGLGDRLGIASVGHIRAIRDLDVFPVLAQQSMRELNLTGRTYKDVLSAAVWAVFREGYTKGYGADGDHLKTHEEVKYALENGLTMITLDCSEHIPYGLKAVADFAVDIYNKLLRDRNVDFELSIDETQTVTTPEDHRYVAERLKKAGVKTVSVAPRFCGEFQKGIDYRGDIKEFGREFNIHQQLADEYGYKLSIHSGSDKFSVFPIISKVTQGRYHLKTAGTNWLEAVRVIAVFEPALYREIHSFAFENLSEARKYYHITCDLSNIADVNTALDAELSEYLDKDDSRQVLHITYGLILQAKAPDGSPRFSDRIYQTLRKHEQDYFEALEKHIGRHLTSLGIGNPGT